MTFYKKRINKVPKGYRLKPSTHKLIYKIQELLRTDQDEVISKACRKYYRELKDNAVTNTNQLRIIN